MSEDIFDLLEHPNPKARFQAIKRIAKSKDDSMLEVLEELAQQDPDPQVREIAQKAIHYIESGGSASAVAPKVKPAGVSKADQERGKAYLDEALSHHSEGGSKAKAVKALKRALAANPELETDHYTISLIESITGLSGTEAMDVVLDEKHHKAIALSERQSSKQKFQEAHMEAASKFTWGTISLDLIIFTLIVIFGTFFGLLVLIESTEGLMASLEANQVPAALAEQGIDLDLAESTSFLNTIVMIVVSVVTGVGALIYLLVWFVGVHWVAKLFRGQGTIQYLIYNITPYYNKWVPVVFLLSYIAITISADPEFAFVGLIIAVVMMVINFLILNTTLTRIGKTYNLSFLSGCLINLIVNFILSTLTAILQSLTFVGFMSFLETLSL